MCFPLKKKSWFHCCLSNDRFCVTTCNILHLSRKCPSVLTCAHSKTLATLMCNIDHCVLADSIGPCNQECVTVVPANIYSPGHPSQHQQRLISGPRWHRPPSPGSLAAESSAPPSPSSPPAEPGDPPTCPAAPAAFLQVKKKRRKTKSNQMHQSKK